MRWLRPQDFKQENAHENINFSAMLFQLQTLYSVILHGYKIMNGKRQALKARQSWPNLRYYPDKINQSVSQSVQQITKAIALPVEGK
jgi:hypothetical protein